MRPWKPVSKKRLADIIQDTEQDCPEDNYCSDDVYRLARELRAYRDTFGEPKWALRRLDLK